MSIDDFAHVFEALELIKALHHQPKEFASLARRWAGPVCDDQTLSTFLVSLACRIHMGPRVPSVSRIERCNGRQFLIRRELLKNSGLIDLYAEDPATGNLCARTDIDPKIWDRVYEVTAYLAEGFGQLENTTGSSDGLE